MVKLDGFSQRPAPPRVAPALRRRRYVDPPFTERCFASVKLGDGSAAQCGRRARYGLRCWQHGGACRLKAEPVLEIEVLAYLLAHSEIKTERGARRALERQRACICRQCRSEFRS